MHSILRAPCWLGRILLHCEESIPSEIDDVVIRSPPLDALLIAPASAGAEKPLIRFGVKIIASRHLIVCQIGLDRLLTRLRTGCFAARLQILHRRHALANVAHTSGRRGHWPASAITSPHRDDPTHAAAAAECQMREQLAVAMIAAATSATRLTGVIFTGRVNCTSASMRAATCRGTCSRDCPGRCRHAHLCLRLHALLLATKSRLLSRRQELKLGRLARGRHGRGARRGGEALLARNNLFAI